MCDSTIVSTRHAYTVKDLVRAITELADADDDPGLISLICMGHDHIQLDVIETKLSDGSIVRDMHITGVRQPDSSLALGN